MILYGYEDYQVHFIDHNIWKSRNNSYCPSLIGHFWSDRSSTRSRMLSSSFTQTDLLNSSADKRMREDPFFISRMYNFKIGDALYFHKGCTIPRVRGEGVWRTVLKPEKADAVVVPKVKDISMWENTAVFINPSNMNIYIARYIVDKLGFNFALGDTLSKIIDENKAFMHPNFLKRQENIADLQKAGDARCMFCGNIAVYNETDSYIFDVIDGIYQKIIFEDDLLTVIGTPDQQFTAEKIMSIRDLLLSKDKESVHLGMRALANLDYVHYPSITKYILYDTNKNWDHFKPFNSAVKFMFRTLGYTAGHYIVPFRDVTPEEFSLARDIFLSIANTVIKDAIDSLQRSTNLVIDWDVNLDVSLQSTKS